LVVLRERVKAYSQNLTVITVTVDKVYDVVFKAQLAVWRNDNGVGLANTVTVLSHKMLFLLCIHGLLPEPFLLSYSVMDFIFPYFFVFWPCAS